MSGYHKRDWETFPMHKVKRVDRPTTLIKDNEVQRVREREAGFCKASAGDYGPVLQQEFRRFVPKHPLSGARIREARLQQEVVVRSRRRSRGRNLEAPRQQEK